MGRNTKEKVQKEIIDALIADAKRQGASGDDLDAVAENLSLKLFQDNLGFDFYEGKPSDVNIIGGLTPVNSTLINAEKIYEVGPYIKNVLMQQVALAPWVEEKMTVDLTNLCTALLNAPLATTWRAAPYVERFESLDEAQKAYGVHASILSAHVEKSKKNINAEIIALYYLGVSYEVDSEKKLARAQLLTNAVEDTKRLTNDASIVGITGIGTALKKFGDAKWVDLSEGFGYNFEDNPPNAVISDAATLVRNNIIKDFNEFSDAEAFNKFIVTEFFSGINLGGTTPETAEDMKKIKDSGIQVWAQEATLQMVDALLGKNAQPSREWSRRKLDQTWDHPIDPGLNPISGNLLFYAYFNRATLDNGVTVEIKIMFIQAIFFEVTNPTVIVTQDLYKELTHNLIRDIQNYVPLDPQNPDSPASLSDALRQFAKQEFRRQWDFDWLPQGLTQATIPGADPGSAMVPVVYGTLLDFTSSSVGRETLENRVSAAIFPKNPLDGKVFYYLQDTLFNDLCGIVDLILNDPSVPKEGNLWYNMPSNHNFEFPPPDGGGRMYGIYSTLVYTFGQRVSGETKIETLFLYYLSVYYARPALVQPPQ